MCIRDSENIAQGVPAKAKSNCPEAIRRRKSFQTSSDDSRAGRGRRHCRQRQRRRPPSPPS
eukprot:13777745-Alexandrium_andersonii.AAC.1